MIKWDRPCYKCRSITCDSNCGAYGLTDGHEAVTDCDCHRCALASRERLQIALLVCARQAEALKRDCSSDPESALAMRNAQYQAISTTAHIALGTIKGPK